MTADMSWPFKGQSTTTYKTLDSWYEDKAVWQCIATAHNQQ